MNNLTPQTFSTKDYWLAGALLAAGGKLLRLDWWDGRAFFVFADLERCDTEASAYWAGDLRVSAKDFTDALRTLKTRLYENENAYKQSRP